MTALKDTTVERTKLVALLAEWDDLRESIMLASRQERADLSRKVMLSRMAAAYEFCADGLRKIMGEKPKYD